MTFIPFKKIQRMDGRVCLIPWDTLGKGYYVSRCKESIPVQWPGTLDQSVNVTCLGCLAQEN